MEKNGGDTGTVSLSKEPTFASPLKSGDLDRVGDRLLLLWGRFWGHEKGAMGAFFINYNISQTELRSFNLNLHDHEDALVDYDPDQSPGEFLRTLTGDLPYSSKTNSRSSEAGLIRDTFERTLHEHDRFEELTDALENKNREQFKDWVRPIFETIYKSSDFTFQIKGKIVLKRDFHQPEETLTEKEQDETSNETDEEEGNGQITLPVNFVTSPVSGKRPDKLKPPDSIYIRITGPVVQNLPGSLVDESDDQSTVPIPRDLLQKEQDGDEMKLTVKIDETIVGEGTVSPDARIKYHEENPAGDPRQNETNDLRFQILLGLLIITTIIFMLIRWA